MSDRSVCVAVVGAAPGGFGARAHIPGIQATEGVELVAVATAHDETARTAAERWGVPRWYGGIDGLLADDEVEIVTIAVRPRMHHPLAIAAIEAGKAVYCEWPLALGTIEAVEMATAAAAHGVATAVGLQGRFVPEMVHLRDLVAAGYIGRPLSFEVSQQLSRFVVPEPKAWLAHENEASGALFVASAHVIDGVRFVLGDIESLGGVRATLHVHDQYADSGRPFEWTASDTVRYVARTADGQIGSLAASNITAPPLGFALRVFGDEGLIGATAPGYYQFTPMTILGGPAGGDIETIPVPAELRRGVDLPEDHHGVNVGRAVAAFANALHSDVAFAPAFDDGVGLHRILDAVIRSSDEGRWVEVAEAG